MADLTARYRFEFRLLAWAESMSRELCGSRRSFFVGIREDGSPRRVYLARRGVEIDGARKAALAETHSRWFHYSPHEVTGTGYLEWLGLPETTATTWLKDPLEPADFVDVRSTDIREGWPEAWRARVA
jgi:hypothetical protein